MGSDVVPDPARQAGSRADAAARHASLFDHHPDAVFELDRTGRLVTGNARLEELTGYPLTELIAMDCLPLVAAADRSRVVIEFHRALRGESRRYAARGTRRDGRTIEAQVTQLPIVVDGEVVGVYGIASDTSGRQSALESLEQSETRFRNIFAASASGIFVLDLEGGFLQANPAFCAMIGLSEQELAGTTVWRLIHADERERVIGLARDLLAGDRDTVVVEARFEAGDGRHVWLKTNVSLVRWPSGAPRYPLGIVEDVTAHKRAEQRLRQGDALQRMAGSIARLGGWSLEAESGTLYWSPETNLLLDAEPDTVATLEEALAVFHGEHRRRITEATTRCLRDGSPFDLEVEVVTATGRRIAVRCVGVPELDPDGRVLAVHGAFQDVDDHQQAVRQNQQLAEQLSDMLETISDGVGRVGSDWTVTYLNSQAERLLGRPHAEVVGQHLLDVYPELLGTRALEAYRRGLEDREPTSLEPFYFAAIQRWFAVKVFPAEPGIVVYFQDVSERIERERRLRAIATVEQRAAKHLRELDHVKNTFLTAVSHELRTPLTVVQGMALTLQRLRGNADPATRNQIEDALAEHAGRLGALLDELLDLDRLARGALVTDRRDAEVITALRGALARAPAPERLQVQAPETLTAFVDLVQVERILGNLIENATKYAPNGPIEVLVRPHGERGVRIEVRDTGPGIPSDQLELVFNPFHRAGDLGAKPGTGIGLALVAAFAQLHDGRAWAEPADHGAHLVVELGA